MWRAVRRSQFQTAFFQIILSLQAQAASIRVGRLKEETYAIRALLSSSSAHFREVRRTALLVGVITKEEVQWEVRSYNSGVIESDTNSTLVPHVTGTPPLTFQWVLN